MKRESRAAKRDLYGGVSPLEAPAYTLLAVAHHLQLPAETVRSWVLGRPYRTRQGPRHFQPLIEPADRAGRQLSFQNLVELHVLSALRRRHQIHMPEVRKAIAFIAREFGTSHPLADRHLFTDGRSVFVEHYGELINASQPAQLEMAEVISLYLQRVEHNAAGVAFRLFPFSRVNPDRADPRTILIDPTLNFGRPVLARCAVPTEEVAHRYKAGDSISSLAEDFRCEAGEIEEAIRYELREAA